MVNLLGNRKRQIVGGGGLAQLVRPIEGFTDRHHQRWLGGADLADCGATDMDTDGDLHLAIPLTAKAIVKV